MWSHLTYSTLNSLSDSYFWNSFHAGQKCLESFMNPWISHLPSLDLHPHLPAKVPLLCVKVTEGHAQVWKNSEKYRHLLFLKKELLKNILQPTEKFLHPDVRLEGMMDGDWESVLGIPNRHNDSVQQRSNAWAHTDWLGHTKSQNVERKVLPFTVTSGWSLMTTVP